MNATAQQILAVASVVTALFYLLLRSRKAKDCGTGCNCGPKKPQAK